MTVRYFEHKLHVSKALLLTSVEEEDSQTYHLGMRLSEQSLHTHCPVKTGDDPIMFSIIPIEVLGQFWSPSIGA